MLFVSDLDLLRGFDYHSTQKDGIALLVARSLPSSREVRQALGRVGRNGQLCSRYMLSSLIPTKSVDATKNVQQKAAIVY